MPIINELIENYDSFEIVRDQLFAILKDELENQYSLANSSELSNKEWYNFNVYRERSQPEQEWDNVTDGSELKGFINVRFNGATPDYSNSPTGGPFNYSGTYLIDVVTASGAVGVIPADLRCILKADLACRLVRNVLQAAEYTNLLLSPVVQSCKIDNIDRYDSESGSESNYKYSGNTFRLSVKFQEQGPQLSLKILDLIQTKTKDENDALIQGADFE